MPIDVLRVAPTPPSVDQHLAAAGYVKHDLLSADARLLDPTIAPRIRAVIGSGAGSVPGALIEALPKLEIITVVGVGFDGVDLNTAKARGVTVTNTPDVLTDDVADLALGLILCVSRELCRAHNFTVAGEWERAPLPLATKVGGKVLGIVGLGRIGKAVARRPSACRFTTPTCSRWPVCPTPSTRAWSSSHAPPTFCSVPHRVVPARATW